jgi:hypothetical protein
MKRWLPLVALGVFFLIGTLAQLSFTKSYYEFSIKMYEMCHDHVKESPASTELCGHITSAADTAYSSAVSVQQLSSIALFNGFLIMGLWIYSLQNKLERLENETND